MKTFVKTKRKCKRTKRARSKQELIAFVSVHACKIFESSDSNSKQIIKNILQMSSGAQLEVVMN